MKYLTKGFTCKSTSCKRPHVSNLNTLTEADRQKLIDFVRDTNGLSWVTGKEPAGTN